MRCSVHRDGQIRESGTRQHVFLAHARAHLPFHLALLGLILGLLFALEHGPWAGQQGLGPHQFGDLKGMMQLCGCRTKAAAGALHSAGLAQDCVVPLTKPDTWRKDIVMRSSSDIDSMSWWLVSIPAPICTS